MMRQNSDSIWAIELYDRRYDWLVASLLAIPAIWLFYGFDAAFVTSLVFALVGALKPLITRLGSRLAAGVFAAGIVLLLSPLLRYVFYDGFCFEGVWSPAADIPRYTLPTFCGQGLFWAFDQEIWVGPLRDVTLPVLGLGLMVFARLDPQNTGFETELSVENDDAAQFKGSWFVRAKPERWLIFAAAALLWGLGSFSNYRAEQVRLEQQMAEAKQAREKERAAQEAEVKRLAAEKAAKRVDAAWLSGSWAPVDGVDEGMQNDKELYCGTDLGMTLKKNGEYHSYEEEGNYNLTDDELRFTNRRHLDWYDESVAPVRLEPSTRKVERDGDYLIMDGDKFGRC